MNLNDLLLDYKCLLHDAADKFTAPADRDYIRHLRQAVLDMDRVRPRVVRASLTLAADQADYAAPADAKRFGRSDWGVAFRQATKYWDASRPDGPIPRPSIVEDAGVRGWHFDRAPSAAELTAYGKDYVYYYYAAHVLTALDATTSLRDADKGLVLLRASAEAMKELAARNVGKPVQLRDGLNSAPKNGTPAALYESLMKEFERQAA